MKYTPAQDCAVHYGDSNLLLSAAAGSGKTAALTGRIIELLLTERAELSDMLIVTYTRAAAAEMRTRLSRRLRELAAEGHRVGRHLAALPSADISTIHSFLYRSLRPYFPSLGLSTDYRIADTAVIQNMKLHAMRDVVDDFFSRSDGFSQNDGHSQNESNKRIASFAECADVFSKARDVGSLDTVLLDIADFLVSGAEDASALDRYADSLDSAATDLLSSPYGRELRDMLSVFTKHYMTLFSELADEFPNYPKVNERYGAVLSYTLEWLERVQSALSSDHDTLRGCFLSYAPPRLGKLSAKDACEVSELFKKHRDALKTDVKHYTERLFPFTGDDIVRSAHRTAAVLRRTREVIDAYLHELERRKRDASALEYSDLETLALRLFIDADGRPTNAAREVGGRYRYLFIDEYQDTNRVQDRIFRALSESSVRFMVGDIKQSIYRFRGAEPEVFSEYRRTWAEISPEEGATAPSFSPDDGRSLFMSENFRCDAPIVRFVNMVSDYTLPHGGIPYSDGDALIHAKTEEVAEPVEVCLIECPRKRSIGEDTDADTEVTGGDENKRDPEALYIARRIHDMLGRYSADGSHIIRASDIAILLRSPSPRSIKSAAAGYEAALAEYGIPVKRRTARSLTSYASVGLLVCLLNVTDNPLRDIPTAGAMRSPVFGFTSADIITIKRSCTDPDMPLYLACAEVARSEGADTALTKRCADFLDRVAQYRTASRGMPSDRYLEYLIGDVGLFSIDGIRGSSVERDAVNRFCMLARSYEGSGDTGAARFGGVSGFLSYLADTDGTNEEDRAPSDSDAVSIMSIHTSKGLEFPICFLAECSKRRNSADERGDVLLDRELGLGMYLPDEGGLVRCGSFFRSIIAKRLGSAATAEEMRMLYVALTRAEHRLIVTAKVADADGAIEGARELAPYSDGYTVSAQGTYIDWIVGAAAKHGDDTFYSIYTIPSSEILSPEYRTSPTEEVSSVSETSDGEHPVENSAVLPTDEELRERFSFVYPYRHLIGIPTKLSVSALYPEILDENGERSGAPTSLYTMTEGGVLREADEDGGADAVGEDGTEGVGTRPSFMTGANEVGGARRGSATHVFMQFASFERLAREGIDAELSRLIEERYMSEGAAELVSRRQLRLFCKSELMDKLCRSKQVWREFRFNARMSASAFTADEELRSKLLEDDVRLTVQGVVDCVFRDPDSGALVLVDYKTDSLTDEEFSDHALARRKLIERHRHQLLYYRDICERMFNEPIREVYIYSTVLGECLAAV